MFYDNFIKLCNQKGVAPSRVAVDIGGNKSDVTRWKRGSRPTDAKLSKLSDYFGVSVSDLLDIKNPPHRNGGAESESLAEINRIAEECSEKDRLMLLDIMRSILERRGDS